MSSTKQDAKQYLPLAPHVFEILLSLSDGELHGYQLIRDIRERTEGDIHLGTSTLYSALRRLLGWRLVEQAANRAGRASGGPPRRYYRITKLGREVARLEALRTQKVARIALRKLLKGKLNAGEAGAKLR